MLRIGTVGSLIVPDEPIYPPFVRDGLNGYDVTLVITLEEQIVAHETAEYTLDGFSSTSSIPARLGSWAEPVDTTEDDWHIPDTPREEELLLPLGLRKSFQAALSVARADGLRYAMTLDSPGEVLLTFSGIKNPPPDADRFAREIARCLEQNLS